MKKAILFVFVLFAGFSLTAQDLQKLATKGAVRLFADKEDLTSVIQIIPDGTVVEAVSADTVFTLIRLGVYSGQTDPSFRLIDPPPPEANPVRAMVSGYQ